MLGSNPLSSMIRRNSTPLQSLPGGQSKIKLSKDLREAEGFDDLPLTFTIKSKETYNNSDNCELCAKKFKLTFRSHHCRVCSKTVCNYCSLERRLSQEDESKYFTCNECDFDLTNGHAKSTLKQM